MELSAKPHDEGTKLPDGLRLVAEIRAKWMHAVVDVFGLEEMGLSRHSTANQFLEAYQKALDATGLPIDSDLLECLEQTSIRSKDVFDRPMGGLVAVSRGRGLLGSDEKEEYPRLEPDIDASSDREMALNMFVSWVRRTVEQNRIKAAEELRQQTVRETAELTAEILLKKILSSSTGQDSQSN